MARRTDLATTDEDEGHPRPPDTAPAEASVLRRIWRFATADSSRLLCFGIVAAAILFNLWTLRAESIPVQNLNDSAVHVSMIDWARERIESGHSPLDGWYPNLGLGHSRFHHYQSFPHILMGYVATVAGTAGTFSWTLYLLLALWPISVYGGTRLLGWGRWSASFAALLSPLLVSTPGLGYEAGSYTWQGYGTWSQLWAMWFLPLAWGLSWRAISRRGSWALAALVIAVTIASHFLTGYLALLALVVLPFLKPSELLRRIGRAALVGGGAVLAASWVLIPLIVDRTWASQNEFHRGTFYYDSFGARRVLSWLFTGEIFDSGRLPVVSLVVGTGLIVCALRFRRDERARALLVLGGLSLVLFFGRPTLGPLLKLLPGSGDMYLRRYIMGVHLGGIVLGGVGLAWLRRALIGWGRRLLPSARAAVVPVAAVVVAAALMVPAWIERTSYHRQGASWIHQQELADRTDGADLAALIEEAKAAGGGRVYAGMRGRWGDSYRVGFVPAFASLLNQGADGIGFTLRTTSLSSPVEVRFDETNPAHYNLYNIRYVIMPADRDPPVPATLRTRRGRHVLWQVETSGYLQVVDTSGSIVADRTNLGMRVDPFLRSSELTAGLYPTVAFEGAAPATPTVITGQTLEGPPGSVEQELDVLDEGTVLGTIVADRSSMVILKASFDPRWSVFIDGSAVSPEMVAPSYVGRTIPPGQHVVAFVYGPYPHYWLLLPIGVMALLALHLAQNWKRGRGRAE